MISKKLRNHKTMVFKQFMNLYFPNYPFNQSMSIGNYFHHRFPHHQQRLNFIRHIGLSFYQMLQCDDGHWAGDYGGPMFLMPGLITALYITKAPFSAGKKIAMIAYLKNHQQEDGGWGTHIECASTMFGSVLSYVSLRLLGEKPDLPYMLEARQFISNHGGALYSPSWCKVRTNCTSHTH